MKNSLNIKDFWWWRSISVSANIQVIIVLLNIIQSSNNRVSFQFLIIIKGINNQIDILLSELILILTFLVFQFRVYKENLTLPVYWFLLINDQETCRDTSTVE